MAKSKTLRIREGGCPSCGGDIYLDYKYGKLYKCLKCSQVFTPGGWRRKMREKIRKEKEKCQEES